MAALPARESAHAGAASAALTGRSVGMALAAVVLFAVFVRWLGRTGFFGSDEVTYIASAFRPLDGNWTLDDYVGANRIGVNFPMAAFAALLGRSELGVAAYGFICSVAEVGVVAWIGIRLFGLRAGVMAGLLLASLPIHASFAGRMLADPPLALLITCTFALFIEAELRRWSTGFFLAGACAGLSFLVKPVTLFVFGIFVFYPLVARRFDPRWLWFGAGLGAAMLVNGLLYQALTGRFWYVFEIMRERKQSGYLESGVAAGEIKAAPLLYFEYLFARIQHTGLVGILAAFGLIGYALRRKADLQTMAARRFVVFWALGLVGILSFLPVSLSPLVFIPKQANYMLIFAAPLCLLGGCALAALPGRWGLAALVPALGGGVVLALLQQASVAVFTSNSWATLDHVSKHPATVFHVMSNAYRAVQFQALLGGQDLMPRIRHVGDVGRRPDDAERFVVIDGETFDWDDSRPFARASSVPACWQLTATLRGQPEGNGVLLAKGIAAIASRLPLPPDAAISERLRQVVEPRPAKVYRVPPGC